MEATTVVRAGAGSVGAWFTQVGQRVVLTARTLVSAVRPPLPADPAERRRALELEEFFDEELGPPCERVSCQSSGLLASDAHISQVGA